MATTYREFENGAYSKLRRDLLREKGGDLQEDFLLATRQDDDFLAFMQEVPLTGGADVDPCAYPLTESEFRNPPVDTQRSLYDGWAAVTPRVACRSSFWGHVTFSHIRQGRIQSVYLAANGNHVGGAERIDRALRSSSERRSKLMDDCVRAILRRLGGLPEARGNRTVYVDCPFARAWWRERFVTQIGRTAPDLRDDIRNIVRLSKAYWEKLVVMVVSRNSVMGSSEIRDALVIRLATLLRSDRDGPVATAAGLVRGCRNLSALQSARELSVLDAEELRQIVDEVIASV